MAKGIRPAVRAEFIKLSVARLSGEFGDIGNGTLSIGNIGFRKAVMDFQISTFGSNVASAATAYNEAKDHTSKVYPELVAGLGREADKKGGRKPGSKNAGAATAETTVEEVAAPVVQAVQTYTVVRVKDGEVQGSDLTLEAANAMIEKAVKGKKAKLAIQ